MFMSLAFQGKARGRSGQKYGGSEGATVRVWIGGGQTRPKPLSEG